MIPWLLITALGGLAIVIAALMAIIAVGHQSHEHGGQLQLDTPQARRALQASSASRVRAEARRFDGRRWSEDDVQHGLAVMEQWERDHPGDLAWYAHSPEEEVEMRERYANRGVEVVAVYPVRQASGHDAA